MLVTIVCVMYSKIQLIHLERNQERAKLLNILNYEMVPILTQVLTGNFLLLLLYLGSTTNRRSMSFYLLVQGH